nr:hypothetical protein GCM10017745_48700 [Saccharothrix mutabilis subsp. capreolus]
MGGPGAAAQRAERDLRLRIAQGMADYHDAISGRNPGERDTHVVEKVGENKTRVTNARTGASVVHDMPLSGYLHPTSKSVEADVDTVVNGEPTTVRQTVKVNEWRKPSDPRYANLSLGETRSGSVVAVSHGGVPAEVGNKLRDSVLLGPEKGKTTADGRNVTIYPRKQQIEHNAEDLDRQWRRVDDDGKVEAREVEDAVKSSVALGVDAVLGGGGTNVYQARKDCAHKGDCKDLHTEALWALAGAPTRGTLGPLRGAVAGAARAGRLGDNVLRGARLDDLVRAGRKSDDLLESGRAPTTPRTTPKDTSPRRAPDREPEPQRPQPPRTPPDRGGPGAPVNPGFRHGPTAAALGLAATGVTAIPDGDAPEQPKPPRQPAAEPEAPTTGDREPRFDDPANPPSLADPEAPDQPRQEPGGGNPITPERPNRPERPAHPHNPTSRTTHRPTATREPQRTTPTTNHGPSPQRRERTPPLTTSAPRSPTTRRSRMS